MFSYEFLLYACNSQAENHQSESETTVARLQREVDRLQGVFFIMALSSTSH